MQEIVDRVKTEGDKTLFELTAKFDWDGISKENVKVTEEEVREAYDTIDPALTETIRKSLKKSLQSFIVTAAKSGWKRC